MNHNLIITISLILSFCPYATINCYNTDHKKDSFVLLTEHKKNLETYIKESNYPKTKTIIATTSMSLGTYLLYDALQTTIDLQNTEQHNSSKGIALNAVIAAGLIGLGSYLLQQTWDEHNPKKEELQTPHR